MARFRIVDSSQILIHALELLIREQVEFVVCGGVACVLQGCQRTTLDLDLSVSFDPENLKRLLIALKELEVLPRVPVPMEALLDPIQRQSWIETKGAMVFTVQSPNGLLQIDLFLQYPIPFEALRAEASQAVVHGYPIPISSIRHLIQAKEAIEPKRPKDRMDLEELRAML
jgi:hypothetical protein